MAKGDICKISNCKNIITKGRKGLICGTHQHRKRKFNSYDLPNHVGEPSFVVKEILPDGIIRICNKHGNLTNEDVYHTKSRKYFRNYCKKCILDSNIKRKYKGINSLDDYEAMLLKQNGMCGICGTTTNNSTRNGKVKRFAIDHCHKTQKVRGLLCQFCNALIGYAKDDTSILDKAKIYLKNNQ